MTTDYNAVQESIKIALDAADAATDVTSEYNKTKREHKKLEASVKNVHRFSVIIFSCSMVTAVAALLFAGLIYFRTMSELDTMTTTSREALVVFAENVDGVNDSLEKMRAALQTQQTLVGLRDIISRSNETMMTGIQSTSASISDSNSQMASSITSGIANELGAQTNRMVKELNALSSANSKALSEMSKSVSDTKGLDRLAVNQKNITRALADLSAQNQEIMRLFNERDNRVSYP